MGTILSMEEILFMCASILLPYTIKQYPLGRPRATIALYPIGRPVILYAIGRPVRATITQNPL